MPTTFHHALRSGRILFFDGAMGTMLAATGVKSGATSNVDSAEVVLEIHRAYLGAGADVLIANTFSANRPTLARSGEADRLGMHVAEACKLARKALSRGGYLAGDIGPTGDLLEPYGTTPQPAMRGAFEETARLLAAGGVDLFLVETMTDAREMTLAVQACRSVAPEIPVAATMAFDPNRQGGFRTSMGVSPADAARAMVAAGADLVGANCGAITPEQMAQVVAEFRRATDKPILAQPNAGIPELREGKTLFRLSPEAFASGMMKVVQAGARLLGGCCGTTPAHISALVAETKKEFPALLLAATGKTTTTFTTKKTKDTKKSE